MSWRPLRRCAIHLTFPLNRHAGDMSAVAAAFSIGAARVVTRGSTRVTHVAKVANLAASHGRGRRDREVAFRNNHHGDSCRGSRIVPVVERFSIVPAASGEEEAIPQDEIDPQAVAPEDYALVVELLDSENGEELKEKAVSYTHLRAHET